MSGHPTIHIILGEEPLPGDRASPGHLSRLNAVATKIEPKDYVICTGGVTVPDALSEAEVGERYLKNDVHLPEGVTFDKEEGSQTTAQNFRFCATILRSMQRYPVVIYGGRSQIAKAWFFRRYYMPDRDVTFRACNDHRSLVYIIIQNVAGGILAFIDPEETWIAKRGWGKKLRRLLDRLTRRQHT